MRAMTLTLTERGWFWILGWLVMSLPLRTQYLELGLWSDATALLILVMIGIFGWRYFSMTKARAIFLGWLVVFILCWQAQWAMAQLLAQTDLGMRHLGETYLDIGEPGIAKMTLFENKFIRGYGPYSHPNVLGGAMVMGVTMLLILQLLNLSEARRGDRNIDMITSVVGFSLMVGAAVSFSRSAFAGLVLALMVGVYFSRSFSARRNVRNWFSRIAVAFILSLVILMSGIFLLRFNDREDVAWPERLAGYRWGVDIIRAEGGFRGIGFGKYREVLQQHLDRGGIWHESWQIDYVHSVPLLLVAEWGVLAIIILGGFLGWMIMRAKRLSLFLIPLIPPLLLDHYLATQPAPLFLLGILLVLLIQNRGIVATAAR